MFKYKKSLFIFRRDLRIFDNNGLNEALKQSQQVIPCFIFDPKQIQRHAYQSKPALHFMLSAINSLQQQISSVGGSLALYYDHPEQIIKQLYKQQQIQAVFINRDYTPFSRQRDYQLSECCQQLGINLHYLADALLTEPEQVATNYQTPYKKFTAFYNKAQQISVSVPKPLLATRFQITNQEPLSIASLNLPLTIEHQNALNTRDILLNLLNQFQQYKNYQHDRDILSLNATSQLSVHIKFGTCSIREVFYTIIAQLGDNHPLLRQLYWRDFFTHIGYHFPSVFGKAFIEKYNQLKWDNNPTYFAAWCAGKTGFPIVDAGMRELAATGLMHNRARMIVASFLVKDLHIDWRWGERYFAQNLLDYDPCVNNGNWQWAASTGCDSQPYFRIFNPWLQQQKFDKDCQYIYQWLPELKKYSPDIIHQWSTKHCDGDYPAPIVDHSHESMISKKQYQLLN